jgi:hypothetical protein
MLGLAVPPLSTTHLNAGLDGSGLPISLCGCTAPWLRTHSGLTGTFSARFLANASLGAHQQRISEARREEHMKKADIKILDERERDLLDESFRSEKLFRRVRGIVFSSAVVLVALISFADYGLSASWFAAIAGTILAVSAIEKVLYHRTMASYESLIRKLVHRVEQLEGEPLTPHDAVPTKIVELRSKAS